MLTGGCTLTLKQEFGLCFMCVPISCDVSVKSVINESLIKDIHIILNRRQSEDLKLRQPYLFPDVAAAVKWLPCD